MPTPFVNEPLVDFNDPAVAAKMEQAIARVRGELGREYPLVIDGQKVKTAKAIHSIDPSNPDNVVGHVAEGTREHAERALQAALAREPKTDTPRAIQVRKLSRARERRSTEP